MSGLDNIYNNYLLYNGNTKKNTLSLFLVNCLIGKFNKFRKNKTVSRIKQFSIFLNCMYINNPVYHYLP
jgi:hypothetical protein